jgi:glycosyltransferase involved in cell wall biosynthesis
MTPISVVVITLNEEENLPQCLSAASKIADELLVVDSFSTDRTKEIALSFGAKVIEHPFAGHIQQKNTAKDLAKHRWVLSLDADEVLSDELINELKEWKKSSNPLPAKVNRLTWYLGKPLKYGDWNPDWKLRLWDKSSGKWDGLNPHDAFYLSDSNAKIHSFKGRLHHHSIPSLDWHIKQVNYFTTISAKELFDKKKKPTFVKLYLSPLVTFVKFYFIKKSFFEGFRGLTAAIISAFYVYLKYAKLKQLYKN